MSAPLRESRLTRRFEKLKEKDRAALVTFITANDPDPAVFRQLLEGLPTAGADIIELGMPFSDPMADGPSVQLSSQRAIKVGVTIDDVLGAVADMREWEMDTPVILMGYYNPIYCYGLAEFAEAAANAGVDGVIIVDLPPEEAEELNQHLRTNNLHMIFLAAPTTDGVRFPRVLEQASGFVYYVAVKGVTGTKSANISEVSARVAAMRTQTDLPLGVGFGIRTASQAAEMAQFADAVVVGSAIVDIITDGIDSEWRAKPGLATRVLDFVKDLANGVQAARLDSAENASTGVDA
ncbi:MAG: tryptophan synthase subunit alpha [Rhodospirillaceae bacterium]|nr:tryptophan synthase subunit alpha [Rhodospirillaceae bacterium]